MVNPLKNVLLLLNMSFLKVNKMLNKQICKKCFKKEYTAQYKELKKKINEKISLLKQVLSSVQKINTKTSVNEYSYLLDNLNITDDIEYNFKKLTDLSIILNNFNDAWTYAKTVKCPLLNQQDYHVKNNPPENCPYTLEHLISN